MTFALAHTAAPPRAPITLALTLVLDPDNIIPGDLHLENGQLHFWDGQEARLQKTIMLLRFVKGEWFLNTDEGIPYFSHILVHNPNLRVIRALFKSALLATPGAASVKSLNLSLDRPSRALTVTFELVFDDGKILTSADYPPFLLRLP
jgi:hypothetical protein